MITMSKDMPKEKCRNLLVPSCHKFEMIYHLLCKIFLMSTSTLIDLSMELGVVLLVTQELYQTKNITDKRGHTLNFVFV